MRDDPAADPLVAEPIPGGGRIQLEVDGQQVRHDRKIGLPHRAQRQVPRGQAQVEQRPVTRGHPATLGEIGAP